MYEKFSQKTYSLHIAVIRVDPDVEVVFQMLREHVERTLMRSAYQNVKLAEIFRKMMPTQSATTNKATKTSSFS